jgi:hypothetical protein
VGNAVSFKQHEKLKTVRYSIWQCRGIRALSKAINIQSRKISAANIIKIKNQLTATCRAVEPKRLTGSGGVTLAFQTTPWQNVYNETEINYFTFIRAFITFSERLQATSLTDHNERLQRPVLLTTLIMGYPPTLPPTVLTYFLTTGNGPLN